MLSLWCFFLVDFSGTEWTIFHSILRDRWKKKFLSLMNLCVKATDVPSLFIIHLNANEIVFLTKEQKDSNDFLINFGFYFSVVNIITVFNKNAHSDYRFFFPHFVHIIHIKYMRFVFFFHKKENSLLFLALWCVLDFFCCCFWWLWKYQKWISFGEKYSHAIPIIINQTILYFNHELLTNCFFFLSWNSLSHSFSFNVCVPFTPFLLGCKVNGRIKTSLLLRNLLE